MTRLYLRIWLAVVAAVLLSTLGVGALLRTYYENQLAQQRASMPAPAPPLREVTVRGADGEVLGTGVGQARRIAAGGWAYQVQLNDGRQIQVVLGQRMRASAAASPPGLLGAPGGGDASGAPPVARELRERAAQRAARAAGMEPGAVGPGAGPGAPFVRDGLGTLALVLTLGVAVALGAYPVIRRITQRLELLKTGVQRFGQGDLSTRVVVVGKDEVAYLTAQFNDSAARIEALMSAHKTLLANASHELRSPLARLRMGMELVQAQPTAALYAEMRRSIQELDELIEEILLASRLSAANASTQFNEPVDMMGLLAEECSRVGAVLDATTEASLSLIGDARLLRRMVRNLLENAKRYGGAGDVIATWDGQAICVMDHGPGVPTDERERIFEPFYRLPGASEASGGVGLGLALVRTIALHHRGQVRCIDRADQLRGACFEVRFSESAKP